MAIVGVAMIAGVLGYTPYVRYWLPAYPLLIASCVLAAGALTRLIPWRPEGRWPSLLAGTALALLLLLPAPLLCVNMPWDAYAKRISTEEIWPSRFQEYPAIRQINAMLAPDDGVLCTGCNGIYLVGGRPYELAFWWNDVHHIHDRESFAGFCRRNEIHYWMVNHASMMSTCMASRQDIVAEYWTDSRLVTAAGTMAVYDVSPEPPRALHAKARRDWPTVLEPPGKPWKPSAALDGWVNLTENAAASLAEGAIAVNKGAWIGHRLPLEICGGLYRVDLDIWSNEPVDPLLEITWYDAEGNLLGRTHGAAHGKSDQKLWIYSVAPLGAKTGWVYLREWKQRPFCLKRAAAVSWKMPPQSRGQQPDDRRKGVR